MYAPVAKQNFSYYLTHISRFYRAKKELVVGRLSYVRLCTRLSLILTELMTEKEPEFSGQAGV